MLTVIVQIIPLPTNQGQSVEHFLDYSSDLIYFYCPSNFFLLFQIRVSYLCETVVFNKTEPL